jgi:uncharacterized protein YyaL (SSP411 family)
VVVVGRTGAPDTQALLDGLRKMYLPDTVVLFRPADEDEPEIVKLVPFTARMKPLGKKAAAYVCSNYRCERPTAGPAELFASLGKPDNR